ncbi:MAG: SDR family oxidoreductase, partial [Fluviibacter sp.]
MQLETSNTTLNGLKGLVVGIANQHSIAWGCAEAFRAAGAELAVTFLNAKAEPHVRPLAESVNASIIQPLDVESDDDMAALFEK